MAITVAKYTFASWLRKGIAANISEIDHLGDGAGPGVDPAKERASVPVNISVNAQPVDKEFALLGPGDVIGINPSLVVRTEPLNWVTDFEPNYFAFIEFYDEDFLWRYTPAKAEGDKLRPWLALILLKDADEPDEREYENYEPRRQPLPVVTVRSAASLPPNSQSWAWAHVNINEGYESDSEFEEFLESLHDLNTPNADKLVCRLMSPRKLEADSAYRAFVVPAFETGRLAGLGRPDEIANVEAQEPSWNADSDGHEFPVYYEWYFRTGENEDFESLVKLLDARTLSERIGIRDMDGSKPGFGLDVGTDIGTIPPAGAIQEIIGLEGALKAPTTGSKPQSLNLSKPFFEKLKAILNFPAELAKSANERIDPVVSPPIYGENHALHHELDVHNAGWLHALNKDPRNRVPAGFGTNVIQKNQDDYMARAWAQVLKIIEANKKIALASFSMTFGLKVKENFTSKLSAEKTLGFFGSLLTKVKGTESTLFYEVNESRLPVTAVSAAFRRIIRPHGSVFRKLKDADGSFSYEGLLQNLNKSPEEGGISPAPDKPVPDGLITVEEINETLPDNSSGTVSGWLIQNRLLLLILILLLLLLIGFLTGAWLAVTILAILAIIFYFYSGQFSSMASPAEIMNDPEKLVEAIRETPPQPEFMFTETDPVVPPVSVGSGTNVTQTTEASSDSADALLIDKVTYHTATGAGQDSLEAQNFRAAALELNSRLTLKETVPARGAFGIEQAGEQIKTAVDPERVFPKQLATMVYFSFNPEWLTEPEHLVPAMAYPDFEDPMYEKLRDISSELMIPNLDLIPPNTISLLKTNPEFIESYMVGLNHEFGKELLWREYPTDKRGSYFRQFWDVRGIINRDAELANNGNLTEEQLRDNYKDITPLDTWGAASALGNHSNRNIHAAEQLVLVVRGELFKKYPNTIVYAQKARINRDTNGDPHPELPPIIVEVETAAQMIAEIKFPVFKAEINPDLKFFGFDLTIEAARGAEDPQSETDDWGYYFVIQEMPGEPRFGMDIQYDPDIDTATPITWDDMAWTEYSSAEEFLKTDVLPNPSFEPAGANESRLQWGSNSAQMAYILYQKPVMIAVHAEEMLKDL